MNMTKKNALGRGLGALIDGVEKEVLEKKLKPTLISQSIQLRLILSSQEQLLMIRLFRSWQHQ